MNRDLLRKFDPAATDEGETLLFEAEPGAPLLEFSSWFTKSSALFVCDKADGYLYIRYDTFDKWRIKPLFWIEGRPVYVGDAMYFNESSQAPGTKVVIKRGWYREFTTQLVLDVEGSDFVGTCLPHQLSWEKPKTKREGYVVVAKLAMFTLAEAENILSGVIDSSNFIIAKAEWEE